MLLCRSHCHGNHIRIPRSASSFSTPTGLTTHQAAGLVYDLAMMRIPRLDYKVISGCWTEEDETSFAVTNDGLGYSERRAWAGSAAAARRAGNAEETSDSDSIRTTLAPNTIGLVALTPKRNAPTMR